MTIKLSVVCGGPEVGWSPISMAVQDAVRTLKQIQCNNHDQCKGTILHVTFHVPGTAYSPDWFGIKLNGYSVKNDTIRTEVAVPPEFAHDSPAKRFILEQINESLAVASSYSGRNSMKIDLAGTTEIVQQLNA
jgi:hypothetical protein